MKNRTELAKYFAQLGFKVGAEVGVLAGSYSAILCQSIPGLKLYCVDSWGLNSQRKKDYYLGKYEQAKALLLPYDCELIRKTSTDAVKDFGFETLDFVYLDADHRYEFIATDLSLWAQKVRPGGIVAGHDYLHAKKCQVLDAVDEYVVAHSYELFVTDKDPKARYKDDKNSSWYFIKV